MIQVFTLEDAEEWDRIVHSFSHYDTYWLSGYAKAFQLNGDGEPQLIYFKNKDSSVRGINVVMKRDIANDPHFKGLITSDMYFDYATPYEYGGWLIDNPEDENLTELFGEYEKHCRKFNVVSEFVRFHPVLHNHEAVTRSYKIVPLGETVAIDLSSPGIIWKKFSSTCRNRIRKSIKNNVRVFSGRCPEIYDSFQQIYNRTMDRNSASDWRDAA